MKLKLKTEYLEWSVNCGGRINKRKLKNVCPSEYQKLWDLGFTEYFEIEKPLTTKTTTIKTEQNSELNTDDTNK